VAIGRTMPVQDRPPARFAGWQAGTIVVVVTLLILVPPAMVRLPGPSARGLVRTTTSPATGSSGSSVAVLALDAAENSIASGHGPLVRTPAGCGPTVLIPASCGKPGPVRPSALADPYDGWGNLTPYLNQSPSSRWGAAIAYDANASDGYVVLFGGEGPHGALGDTWTFQHGDWINVTPTVPTATNSPSPRFGAAMAYDSSAGYVVLFGGASGPATGSSVPLLNDTWGFLHGVWTQLCLSCETGRNEPSSRLESSASDDPGDGGVILFGGLTLTAGSYSVLNDTWEFVNGSWTILSPQLSPPGRYGAGLTFSSMMGPLVLFGGCAQALPTGGPTCVAPLNDSWTFSADVWKETPVAPLGPGGRSGFGFAFGFANSSAKEAPLTFGGLAAGGLLNGTWELESGTWTNLTSTLDSSPSPRDDVALTYDPSSGTDYFVLFGGWNGTFLSETWVYPSPFAPLGVSAPVSNRSVSDVGQSIRLNVTITGGAGLYRRTWFGLPTGCASANTSSVVCHPTLSGSYTVSVRVRDAVGSIVWSVTTTVQVYAKLTAIGIAFANGINEGTVPWNATLIATWIGGSPPFVFSWDFGDGSPDGSGNPVAHVYQKLGSFIVTALVIDAAGQSVRFGGEKAITANRLVVRLNESSSTVTLGSRVTLWAEPTGGFPWYAYVWTGLPSTCPTTNASSLNCSLNADGTYLISVHVMDAIGDTAGNSTSILVIPTQSSGPISTALVWIISIAVDAAIIIAVVWGIQRSKRKRFRPTSDPISPSSGPPRTQ